MASDLVIEIGGILPFAERTLDDVLCDEAELLEPLVKKLYEMIVETASFICKYIKRSPPSKLPSVAMLFHDSPMGRQSFKPPSIIGRLEED